MPPSNRFARNVFLWAGIYGIGVLLPLYALEERLGHDFPPPTNHPEQYYGFVGVALAWQFAFIVISRDVVRFRPLMLAAVAEKLLFVASSSALYAAGRIPVQTAGVALPDLLLAVLFLVARARTPALPAGDGAVSR